MGNGRANLARSGRADLPRSRWLGLPPALWAALAGLALLLVVGLALVLRGVAHAVIVLPLQYAWWLGRLVFESIPGWIWWAWFVLMALVIASKSLRMRQHAVAQPGRARTLREGPVRLWMGRVLAAPQGIYFRWRLAHDLAQLSLDLLGHQGRLGPEEIEHIESIEELRAPPEIQAYLRAGLAPQQGEAFSLKARLLRLLRPGAQTIPLDCAPEKVVQFLESQLETLHED